MTLVVLPDSGLDIMTTPHVMGGVAWTNDCGTARCDLEHPAPVDEEGRLGRMGIVRREAHVEETNEKREL